MTIRIAHKEDSEYIFKIWQACFTDDQAYIDNYLKYCLPYTQTWLLSLDSLNVVSCLSILPSHVYLNNKLYKGGYLYAVGTLPEFRGNAYSKKLMEQAIIHCKNENLSYLLVKPADEGLYEFYLNSSFSTEISQGITTLVTSFDSTKLCDYSQVNDLETSDLLQMRKDSFSSLNYLWPAEILNYAIIEAKSRSGKCKIIKSTGNTSLRPLYFIAYPEEFNRNSIVVLETNAKNPAELECLVYVLKNEYPLITEAKFITPVDYLDSVSYIVKKSALVNIFDEKLTIPLQKRHLSLPLE